MKLTPQQICEAYHENEIRDALQPWKQYHPRTFDELVNAALILVLAAKPKPYLPHIVRETGTISGASAQMNVEQWHVWQ